MDTTTKKDHNHPVDDHVDHEMDDDVFQEANTRRRRLRKGPKVDRNAFANLSDTTKKSFYEKRIQNTNDYLLILYKLNKDQKTQEFIITKLKEVNPSADALIESIQFTLAGNLLVHTKNESFYKQLLNVEEFLDGKKFKSIDDPTKNLSIVIKDITYNKLKEHENSLKERGIVSLIEIKSMKKDGITNCVKAICESEEKMIELFETGLKIGLCIHRVVAFKKPIRIIVCHKCSGFNHVASECKSKKVKCFKCSGEHEAFKCDIKEDSDKKLYKCPHCEGNHPATYAGCAKFKEKLAKIKAKKNKNEEEEEVKSVKSRKSSTVRIESDNPIPISQEAQRRKPSIMKPHNKEIPRTSTSKQNDVDLRILIEKNNKLIEENQKIILKQGETIDRLLNDYNNRLVSIEKKVQVLEETTSKQGEYLNRGFRATIDTFKVLIRSLNQHKVKLFGENSEIFINTLVTALKINFDQNEEDILPTFDTNYSGNPSFAPKFNHV
jgi:hypothetical protein